MMGRIMGGGKMETKEIEGVHDGCGGIVVVAHPARNIDGATSAPDAVLRCQKCDEYEEVA